MITLYDYWQSSAAYRIRIALNLLGLPYRSIPIDLAKGEQRSPENLDRNPQGFVPMLGIDGMTLTQSLAILQYLDEAHGANFLPPDPSGRARTRALAYAIAMETTPVCNLSVRNYAAQNAQCGLTPDSWQTHFIIKGFTAFELMPKPISKGRYCHGDTVTTPDICLIPRAYNARRIGLDLTAYPSLSTISRNLETLPAVQSAHPNIHKPKG